jgi:hypothetical protein
MFDYCKLENKKCSFCTGVFCGLALGQNRINKLGRCPKGLMRRDYARKKIQNLGKKT